MDGEDYDDDGDGIPDTEDEDHPDFGTVHVLIQQGFSSGLITGL